MRLRKKIDKSRIKLECIPPEAFRISNDAKDIEDAAYVAIQQEMTKSDLRKYYPEWADELDEQTWSELGTDGNWLGVSPYSQENCSKKRSYWSNILAGYGL